MLYSGVHMSASLSDPQISRRTDGKFDSTQGDFYILWKISQVSIPIVLDECYANMHCPHNTCRFKNTRHRGVVGAGRHISDDLHPVVPYKASKLMRVCVSLYEALLSPLFRMCDGEMYTCASWKFSLHCLHLSSLVRRTQAIEALDPDN